MRKFEQGRHNPIGPEAHLVTDPLRMDHIQTDLTSSPLSKYAQGHEPLSALWCVKLRIRSQLSQSF